MARRERARTLLVHAASVPAGWQRLVADTINGRLHLRAGQLPKRLSSNSRIAFALDREYERLSYVLDWKEAFEASPRLGTIPCDVNDAIATWRAGRRVREFELIVVLHSAAGDNLDRVRGMAGALQRRRAPLLVLFGNEYTLMKEKIAFAREVGAEFIGSQLPEPAAEWLYAQLPARVLAAPAALNPTVYRPLGLRRPVDVGFRGAIHDQDYALGDLDRSRLLKDFGKRGPGLGLRVDIAFERLPREGWTRFLNSCRYVIGAESGTRYLERDDSLRSAVTAFKKSHPEAPFKEIRDRFFVGYPNPVSGKAISSRHLEPTGTETAQVLVAGDYNGILRAGEHYIPVSPGPGSIAEVARRLADEAQRIAMARRTREYVLDQHTYAHRISSLLEAILG